MKTKIFEKDYPGIYHSSTGYMFPLLSYLAQTGQPLYLADESAKIMVPGANGTLQEMSVVSSKIKTGNLKDHYTNCFKSIAEANSIEVIEGNPTAPVWSFTTLEEREQVNWEVLFATPLKLPAIDDLFASEKEAAVFKAEVNSFKGYFITVSQKLQTDDPKLTEQEKSIGWPFFNFVKGLSNQWVLGQHFAKGEAEEISAIAEKYGVEMFDKNDESGLLGWRGIDFAKQVHLMKVSGGMLNIASTTTWIGLIFFPWLKQIIYYANKDSNKIWKTIADVLPTVKAIGFDADSDLEEIAKETISFFK